mmetsp:Transcript_25811/g.29484  ORF Transcript_25811/g.29484 Transcript_25811/m.29484 type:complete len:124 (-) Transcript_25811:137-508(-)
MENQKYYKESLSFQKRKQDADTMIEKYPRRVPVIVERVRQDAFMPTMDVRKFLIPSYFDMARFNALIRKRLSLSKEHAIFLMFDDNTIMTSGKLMSQIYKEKMDKDGFLYVKYSSEKVTGGCD